MRRNRIPESDNLTKSDSGIGLTGPNQSGFRRRSISEYLDERLKLDAG